MDNLVRTTITLPETLLEEVRYYLVANRTNLSQLIRESLKEKISRPKLKKNKYRSILALSGSLNLGGKEPPTREELYDDYFKEKFGF